MQWGVGARAAGLWRTASRTSGRHPSLSDLLDLEELGTVAVAVLAPRLGERRRATHPVGVALQAALLARRRRRRRRRRCRRCRRHCHCARARRRSCRRRRRRQRRTACRLLLLLQLL